MTWPFNQLKSDFYYIAPGLFMIIKAVFSEMSYINLLRLLPWSKAHHLVGH